MSNKTINYLFILKINLKNNKKCVNFINFNIIKSNTQIKMTISSKQQ